jgi:hypothetical protein
MTEEIAKIDPQAAPREVLRAWFIAHVGFDPFDDGWDEADLRVAISDMIQAEREQPSNGRATRLFGNHAPPIGPVVSHSFAAALMRSFEAA